MNYADIDKEVSFRIKEIYSDPEKHKFHSEHQEYEDRDERGIYGGRIRGKKRKCFHCGMGFKSHALEDERI